MDWTSFFEGYSVGTLQMLAVDAVILVIVWPLRQFIGILKDPIVRARIRILLGLELTPVETAALAAAGKKA